MVLAPARSPNDTWPPGRLVWPRRPHTGILFGLRTALRGGVSWVLHGVVRGIGGLFWATSRGASLVALAALLAGVAAIPVLNVWALGALLEAEGMVARTGRLRSGFPLRRAAARLGGMLAGAAIYLLPLRFLAGFAADAAIVDPDGVVARRLARATVLAAAAVFVHLMLALLRGGRFRDFFRPIANLRGGWRIIRGRLPLDEAVRPFQQVFANLRPWDTWRAGLVGALGGLAWTLLPTTLYAAADAARGPAILVTILGGAMLAVVLTWVPILQAGYARDRSWRCFGRLAEARLLFARCPLLWTLVFLFGYAGSLVLYLFKIVVAPQDAVWLMTPFFILVIYPVRLSAGWVYARASRQKQLPWVAWRYGWGAVSFLLVGFYVLLLFFSRDIGAYGKLVLYQQPFLLVPTPF
jgi:uncharacterized membrane protein SirB2